MLAICYAGISTSHIYFGTRFYTILNEVVLYMIYMYVCIYMSFFVCIFYSVTIEEQSDWMFNPV